MNKRYCPKCGLEFRRYQVLMRMGICQECEPDKFKEQHDTDIKRMIKRNVGQEHITEYTFFPAKPSGPWFHWYRRINK